MSRPKRPNPSKHGMLFDYQCRCQELEAENRGLQLRVDYWNTQTQRAEAKNRELRDRHSDIMSRLTEAERLLREIDDIVA